MTPSTKVVDALGTFCPEPIIALAREVRGAQAGEIIELRSDDPATWADLQAWSRMTGHTAIAFDAHIFHVTV